jgi:DNA-binding XRE family transcriptional regulator
MGATRIGDDSETDTVANERLNRKIFEMLMDAKGIPSIAELARRAEVHKSTIFRLRAGKTKTTFQIARAIARELDTTTETLFARAPQ